MHNMHVAFRQSFDLSAFLENSMLEITERILNSIKQLKKQTEELVVSGGVKDMEHYKYLMGRLEGYKYVEISISEILKKNYDA